MIDNEKLFVIIMKEEDFKENLEAKINHFISLLQKLIERKTELRK